MLPLGLYVQGLLAKEMTGGLIINNFMFTADNHGLE